MRPKAPGFEGGGELDLLHQGGRVGEVVVEWNEAHQLAQTNPSAGPEDQLAALKYLDHLQWVSHSPEGPEMHWEL